MGYQSHATGARIKQFNIMPLVGNGFDLQALQHFDLRPQTSYRDFFHFLRMNGVTSKNLIVSQMEELRDRRDLGPTGWSDVEYCISELAPKHSSTHVLESLNEIQEQFSSFLNHIINPQLLNSLNKQSRKNLWSIRSLSSLLGDIDRTANLQKITFGDLRENKNIYNFQFINFNYTPLLDNYLFLDSEQFEPKPHASGTNFIFNNNPRRLGVPEDDSWNFKTYNYLTMDIAHPHGHQSTPRSLLFGTDGDPEDHRERSLSKTYWSQAEMKYGHLFEDTDLFIIFGCSLGKTDSWWWNNIAKQLLSAEEGHQEESEEVKISSLMIYKWGDDEMISKTKVKNDFLDAAGITNKDQRKKIKSRIIPIPYTNDTKLHWLTLTPRTNG